jgi:NAD+ kinase
MGRKTVLLYNATKPEATQATSELRDLVRRYGSFLGEAPAESSPLPAEFKSAELYVVLGGDGTLLSQARRCAGPRSAMLGVNMGRLGFLASFDLKTVRSNAQDLFGLVPLRTREYILLTVEVYGKGDKEPRFFTNALNDAVITAGPPYRLITLSISMDRQEGPTIRGDGLIVCSPVGSTAYNLSAGGPALDPTLDAFCITPIAPQSLSFRPVVVNGASEIEIGVVKPNSSENGHGTTLVLDGQIQAPLKAGDRIVIRKHDHGIRFVVNEKNEWWTRLMSRLQWATPPKLNDR